MNSTKGRIAQAFKEIVCRKSFQKITISDIARECDMTRENFYYHFRDKFDIIRWIFENEILLLLEEKMDFEDWLGSIIDLFLKEKVFYIRITNEIGKEILKDNFHPILKGKIQTYVEYSMDKSVWNKRKEKVDFVTEFFSGAMVELIFGCIMDKEMINGNQVRENLEFLLENYLPFVRIEKEM